MLKALQKKGERAPVLAFTSGTPTQGFQLLQDAQMALMSQEKFKGERANDVYYQDLQTDRANWLV